MRVFVLTTGRTGSTTVARAFGHATNYTSGHESRVHQLLPGRLDFPDQHIEVDNRLFFYLGVLDEMFGHEAFYVHLTRDPDEVARSYRQRWGARGTIGRSWARSVLLRQGTPDEQKQRVTRDMVDAMNAGIRLFMRDKPHTMTMRLEDCPEDFLQVWDAIGAEGDRLAAEAEWRTRHNATPERKLDAAP